MDARILLPLLVLPFFARRRPDSPPESDAETLHIEKPASKLLIKAPIKPPIQAVDLPSAFRKMSARTASVDAIVMHCTEGGGDALKSAFQALRPVEAGGRKASFHNVIGRDGLIVQVVPWERQAWHCTSLPGFMAIRWNNRSIGIELCALPTQKLTARQERSLVQPVRYPCMGRGRRISVRLSTELSSGVAKVPWYACDRERACVPQNDPNRSRASTTIDGMTVRGLWMFCLVNGPSRFGESFCSDPIWAAFARGACLQQAQGQSRL